jgi:hypothetical protein
MSATNPTIDRLFDGGPPLKIEHLLRLVKPDDPGIARRALIVILISWSPLLVLTAIQEFLHRNGSLWEFMLDFGAYGRFLIAAPIFILAEGWCLPALGRIIRHFLDFGIIRTRDLGRFDMALRTTRSLLDSTLAEVLTVMLAYAATAALRFSVYLPNLPRWSVQADSDGLALSAAGLWQLWVSLPLLFILFFGWIWRQFLWCRLMWRIAQFDLNLIAAHPDRAGGLRFLGSALWGYCPLSLALAAIVAGGVANQIRQGAALYDFRFFVLGLVLCVLVLFVAPFLIFTPVLRGLRSRGSVEYGTLSCAVGHEFEAKWVDNGTGNSKSDALAAPDFSATTDLYSIASNVYQMRYLPLSSKAVGELLVFTLIPFVPLVLLSVPIDTLLRELKAILL